MEKLPKALCDLCPLRSMPCVPSKVPHDATLVIVGDRPGIEEERKGEPFIGQEGQLVERMARQLGGDPATWHKTNLVACRTPSTRPPTEREIACCAPRLDAELAASNAPVMLSLGKLTNDTLLRETTPIVDNGAWVRHITGKALITSPHPMYYMHSPARFDELRVIIEKAIKGPQTNELQKPPKQIHIQTFEDLQEVIYGIPDESWVAFDVETTKLYWHDRPYANVGTFEDKPVKREPKRKQGESLSDFWGRVIDHEEYIDNLPSGNVGDPIRECSPKGEIIMLSLCYDLSFAYIIKGDLLREPRTTTLLQQFNSRVNLCAQNGKFDLMFLMNNGLWFNIKFDTMLADFVLNENRLHGLKEMATREFDIIDYEEKYVKPYIKKKESYANVPYNVLAIYAAWDVAITLALRELFEKRLRAEKLYDWPWSNIIVPANMAFAQIQRRGAHVDVPYLFKLETLLRTELAELTNTLRDLTNRPAFNPRSSPQVAEMLYDVYGLPTADTFNRMAAPRTTDKAALKILGEEVLTSYPDDHSGRTFLATLLHYRRLEKIRSSYVTNVIGFISEKGTLHCDFKMTGTVTGRLSTTDPALQTIPTEYTREGQMIRGAFIAPKGKKIVMVDYSQAELRVLAHVTQDPFLLRAFREGKDVHTEATLLVFGDTSDQGEKWLTPEDKDSMPKWFNGVRKYMKNGVFACIYGGKPESVTKAPNFPRHKAKDFVKGFRSSMARLFEWQKEAEKKIKTKGYIQSTFKRKRRFPFINDKNAEDARKAACNAPIQGDAGDLTTLAATRLNNEGVEVFLTVHDSIFAYANEDEVNEVKEHMENVMIEIASFYFHSIPWKVDTKIADAWTTVPDDMLRHRAGSSVNEAVLLEEGYDNAV